MLTLKSLEGNDRFELSMKYFDKWKLGKKGVDNGVLLLVALSDRQAQITTGDGW